MAGPSKKELPHLLEIFFKVIEKYEPILGAVGNCGIVCGFHIFNPLVLFNIELGKYLSGTFFS